MIHFVGAGPGAVDLITLRGQRLLTEADVIIYAGSLVNAALLESKKKGAVVYNSASMTLEEVILVMQENRDKEVVRLHTGDPSLYGAIQEQMTLLDECDIPYDVTPGVSSFLGAASSLCLEYTLPGVSQSLILTRVEGRTSVPKRESIRALASHQTSMVFFLSTSLLIELTEQLIEGGYHADTPAALVYRATWPDEKKIKTTVARLSETAQENGIHKTALVLVGPFINGQHEKSKLYDKHFSHEFRSARELKEEGQIES